METVIPQEMIDAGRGYEALFVPALFAPWTPHLLAAAEVSSGDRVLDVACGTGVLARAALDRVGPAGSIYGVDPSPGMLFTAREREPDIEWVQGSAESLDFPDVSFDRVVSQFGIMFFGDRQQAVREMYRVLKPGGAAAIAAWRSVEHNPAYADIIAILEEQVGSAAADALRSPFKLGDSEAVVAVLEGAGFTAITAEEKTEYAVFQTSRQVVEAELRGWLPLFDIILDEAQIQRVLLASDRTLSKYSGRGDEVEFPTAAHIVSARKPR